MAIYNEILAGRYPRMWQKLFGMKGSAPTRQLGGEIMPVIQHFNGAENRFLELWNLFASATSQAAVAASFSTFQWRNPVGSNVVAVFEKITTSGATADAGGPNLSIGFNPADLTTPLAATQRDGRVSLLSSLIGSRQALGAVTPLAGSIWTPGPTNANFYFEAIAYEDQQIVLPPGFALRLLNQTANALNQASFFWRERHLEESERQ